MEDFEKMTPRLLLRDDVTLYSCLNRGVMFMKAMADQVAVAFERLQSQPQEN